MQQYKNRSIENRWTVLNERFFIQSWINSIFESLLHYYRFVMLFCATYFWMFFTPLSHCSFRALLIGLRVFHHVFPGKFTFEKWRTEHKQQQSTGHSIRAINTMKCCTIWRICVRFAISCRIEKKYYIRSDKCFNSDSISWMQFFNLICMQPMREMVCMWFFSWLL